MSHNVGYIQFFPHIHHESLTTKRDVTTASITTVLNLIIHMFVLIALSLHLVPCLFFSLQSSDIYLFHFKREKRKKVRLKRLCQDIFSNPI